MFSNNKSIPGTLKRIIFWSVVSILVIGTIFFVWRAHNKVVLPAVPLPSMASQYKTATFHGEPIDFENGNPINYFTCTSTSDCTTTNLSNICICPASDNTVAINKKYIERWNVRTNDVFSVCYGDGAIGYAAPSCQKGITTRCINSVCRLIGHR